MMMGGEMACGSEEHHQATGSVGAWVCEWPHRKKYDAGTGRVSRRKPGLRGSSAERKCSRRRDGFAPVYASKNTSLKRRLITFIVFFLDLCLSFDDTIMGKKRNTREEGGGQWR